jgi:hypothetical protein
VYVASRWQAATGGQDILTAKSRKRNRYSERKDWYKATHRLWDKRSVARCVQDGIDIAVGNPLLADMNLTVY